ncbi:MAG: HlyC/CorC family transporter [Planctomycetes bacterium]|nr:HlyC/CorC family transporter [Planctomycetota bacterium]
MAEFLQEHAWQTLSLLILLGFSAFFSGSETSLFNLSRREVNRLKTSGPAGRIAASLLDHPRRLLGTLLLCNMVVNVAYAGISAVLVLSAAGFIGSLGAAGVSIALLVLLILIGEVMPKSLASRISLQFAQAAAGPLAVIHRAAGPVVWAFEHIIINPLDRLLAPRRLPQSKDVTADELATMLHLSARRGVLDRGANVLLQEILALTDLRVSDVMVPRVDMVAFDINRPRQELEEMFRRTHLRRLPVYDGHIDNIVGLIQAKRLFLSPQTPLRELIVNVIFVPLPANLEKVLLQLRVMRTQIAIVVDEYGGVAGLVTLEDILEEIVGDIPDAHERQYEPLRHVGNDEYIVDGDVAIHDWAEMFNINLAHRRISTVGGLVVALLGHIPKPGEQVRHRNMLFTVESVVGRRVATLRVKLVRDQA